MNFRRLERSPVRNDGRPLRKGPSGDTGGASQLRPPEILGVGHLSTRAIRAATPANRARRNRYGFPLYACLNDLVHICHPRAVNHSRGGVLPVFSRTSGKSGAEFATVPATRSRRTAPDGAATAVAVARGHPRVAAAPESRRTGDRGMPNMSTATVPWQKKKRIELRSVSPGFGPTDPPPNPAARRDSGDSGLGYRPSTLFIPDDVFGGTPVSSFFGGVFGG